MEWGRPSMGSISQSHVGKRTKDCGKPGRLTVREPRRQKGFQAAREGRADEPRPDEGCCVWLLVALRQEEGAADGFPL